MRINLKAATDNQKLILNYLEQNASDMLVEKINNGKKTLSECWSYITGEARKRAVSGCAVIEDREVYGWAVHFFQEDKITAPKSSKPINNNPAPAKKKKTERKKDEKPKAHMPSSDTDQLSLFELLEA